MNIVLCDRCGKEIARNGRGSLYKVQVNVGGASYLSRVTSSDLVLCEGCYKSLEVEEKTEAVSKADKQPNDIERFLDMVKILIKECVEEMEAK